jgi:UDP-N-acetylmuramate--alanine ligase
MPKISADVISFGRGRNNMYRYEITDFRIGGFSFNLYKFDNKLGALELNIPGDFNVHNASCAAVVALELGVDFNTVKEAISAFSGIARRLERLGDALGRPLYYDYAHHPTEIRASLTAIRALTKGNITVLFKPHTYTRTASLWDQTCAALSLADHIIITDIYAAREKPVEGISAQNLARAVGKGAVYMPDSLAADYIMSKTDGAIILMGAGDVTEIKRQLTR